MGKAKSKPRLTVVGRIGTPPEVLEVLADSLCAAEDDEILAVAIVEVRREGEILFHTAGCDKFRHQLYAGCSYAMRHIDEQ